MKIGNKEVSLIKIIILAILVILILLVVIQIVNSNRKKTNINDFKSSKEVVEYLGSKFISRTINANTYPIKIKLKFKYLPYNEDNTSNENYYNQMIAMIGHVEKYANFTLVDDENKITVKVDCEPSTSSITNININDINNYFAVKNNTIELDNYTKINNTDVKVDSSELENLIENNWKYNKDYFGIQDSTYKNYDIFFDEGIEVRKITSQVLDNSVDANKVFNIVFTNKYKNKVVNNLKVDASLQDVINSLGQPQYGNIESGLIGYKSEKFYIFFNSNKQISIYRVENPDKGEFAKIISKFLSEKNSTNLISNIISLWPEYDNYSQDLNNNSKYLLYSLYGVKIQFNVSNEHGIILYNNYTGKVTEDIEFNELINKSKDIPKNIYIKNTDLVYETEQTRIYSNIPDFNVTKHTNKFVAMDENMGNFSYKLRILSISDEYPSSEINNLVNTFEWIDETHLVYSRKNVGIYVYNAATLQTKAVIEGNDIFNIIECKDGIIKYDNGKKVKVEM